MGDALQLGWSFVTEYAFNPLASDSGDENREYTRLRLRGYRG